MGRVVSNTHVAVIAGVPLQVQGTTRSFARALHIPWRMDKHLIRNFRTMFVLPGRNQHRAQQALQSHGRRLAEYMSSHGSCALAALAEVQPWLWWCRGAGGGPIA